MAAVLGMPAPMRRGDSYISQGFIFPRSRRCFVCVLLVCIACFIVCPTVGLLKAWWRHGARCMYQHLLPNQLAILHFKKTFAEFRDRYYGEKMWSGGEYQIGLTGRTVEELEQRWPKVNGYRNACPIVDGGGRELVLDRLVRQRTFPLASRAQVLKGPFCTGGECQAHFLTLEAPVGQEEAYIAEWLDWHFAVGVDFVILFITKEQWNSTAALRDVVKGYVEVGLVDVRLGHPALPGTFQQMVRDTWWLLRLDTDAFIYSPQEGPVFDFLANALGRGPEQYLVPRFDMGDDGQVARPGDFMARAYRRSEAWASIFQPILYAPAGVKKGWFEGSPHVWSHRYSECGGVAGIWRVGPLIICPGPFSVHVHFIGWPTFGARRITSADVAGRPSANLSDVAFPPAFGVVLVAVVSCAYVSRRNAGEMADISYLSVAPSSTYGKVCTE